MTARPPRGFCGRGQEAAGVAEERTDEGFFSARDGVRLFWHTERAASPTGHVALLHGYAEHLGRQSEIMRSRTGDIRSTCSIAAAMVRAVASART